MTTTMSKSTPIASPGNRGGDPREAWHAKPQIFGGGVQRVRLGLHRFVGDGLRPPDFINPHDDETRRLDRHNADDDDDEQEHSGPIEITRR